MGFSLAGTPLTIALLAGVLLPSAAGRAAPVPNADRIISYAVVQQDLPSLIAAIAGQAGLRADVDAKVGGEVRGRLPAGTATQTLDRLAAIYGFDWYCDGATLHVSSAAEARTAILPLGAVSAPVFLHALDAFGIADPRWPVRLSGQRDVAFVDGPPVYVGLVERTLDALARRDRNAAVTVSVFRGAAG